MRFVSDDLVKPNQRISQEIQIALDSFEEAIRGIRGKGVFVGWDATAYRSLAKKSIKTLIPRSWALKGMLYPESDGVRMAQDALKAAEENDFTAHEAFGVLLDVINKKQALHLAAGVKWHGTLGGRYHSWILEGSDDDLEDSCYEALVSMALGQPVIFWARWEWFEGMYKSIMNPIDHVLSPDKGSSYEKDWEQFQQALNIAKSSFIVHPQSLERLEFHLTHRIKAKWLGWEY